MTHDPDEQIPFDADLPASAPAVPETITVLGRTLPLTSPDCYRESRDGLWVQVWFSDGTWTVLVMSESYPRVVEVRVSEPTLADAERVWLEYASLEAPRLCALVVDGMQPKAA